ncbi:MAG: SUF system NifU family Fe-S cluster assembly protein [Candidatus Woesearchaeota archaeon]|nr:SUF system NifU family Fe-S cluster assembly protein [Candidatus Woesearchaeota archaeon]
MSLDIYKENILEHYENPKNFGNMKDPDVKSHDTNPLCGDSFDFEFRIKDDMVKEVKFHGHGCAISTASASMLTEKIIGMSLEDIKKLDEHTVKDLVGIELSHVRIKCAMLPLKVIKLGVYDYIAKK